MTNTQETPIEILTQPSLPAEEVNINVQLEVVNETIKAEEAEKVELEKQIKIAAEFAQKIAEEKAKQAENEAKKAAQEAKNISSQNQNSIKKLFRF